MKDGCISICSINVIIYYDVITMLGICFDEQQNLKACYVSISHVGCFREKLHQCEN